MGNKGNKKEKSEVMENEEAVVNHPRINNVTIRRTNKHHEYMETNVPITDKKDYDSWKKILKDSPGEKSPYALHPRKHDMKKQSTCGKSGTAKVEYDNYSYTLKDEIWSRKKSNGQKFEETQIWYLLNALADVGQKFHLKNLKIGDVRPQNIFVNENGELKVATQHSWPKEITNYEKFLFQNQPTYLAPEEINDVQVGRDKSTSDIEVAESFSIGLTALDAAVLDDSEKMYQKNSFNYEILDYKRKNFLNEPKYSQLLKIVIINLTSPQFGKRLTSRELKQFLLPNQGRIVALQNFSVNDIPYKLKNTAEELKMPGSARNSEIDRRSSKSPQNHQSYRQSNYRGPNSQSLQQGSYKDQKIHNNQQITNQGQGYNNQQGSYQGQKLNISSYPGGGYETFQRTDLSPRSEARSKYRLTLAEVQEKVAKSRALNP